MRGRKEGERPMHTMFRTTMSLPLAGLITISLAALMAYLISVEGEPGPSVNEIDYELFPRVTVIDPVPDEPLAPVDAVDPPPPPPVIEVVTASAPSNDYIVMAGDIPDFAGPDIDPGATSFDTSDRDVQPVVRIPPDYPMREAERGVEGHCVVMFDVTTQGSPVNIRPVDCTTPGFERATIRAVERWRYNPRVRNGQPQMYRGVQTRLEFTLQD